MAEQTVRSAKLTPKENRRERLRGCLQERLSPARRGFSAHEDRWLLVLALLSWLIVGAIGESFPSEWGMWGNLLAEAWGAGVAGVIFWRILVKRESAVQEETFLREHGQEMERWLQGVQFDCELFSGYAFFFVHTGLASLTGEEVSAVQARHSDLWAMQLTDVGKELSIEESQGLSEKGIAVFGEMLTELGDPERITSNGWNWQEVKWRDEWGASAGVTIEENLVLGEGWLDRLPTLGAAALRLRVDLRRLRTLHLRKAQHRQTGQWQNERECWLILISTSETGISALRLIWELNVVRDRIAALRHGR